MPIKHRILPALSRKVVDRFWSKVKMQPSGCWEWQPSTSGHSYGHMRLGNRHSVAAHRIAYKIYYLQDPAESLVLHICDNTICVNPLHLFLGTQQENVDDMRRKKRHAHGHKVPQCKLTESQVTDIRTNYRPRKQGVSMYAFAEKYNVTPATIHRVIHNVCWKHI